MSGSDGNNNGGFDFPLESIIGFYPKLSDPESLPECHNHVGPFMQYIQALSFHFIIPHAPPVVHGEPPNHNDLWNWENGYPPMDYLGAYFPGNVTDTGYHINPPGGRRIELYPERIRDCAKYIFTSREDIEIINIKFLTKKSLRNKTLKEYSLDELFIELNKVVLVHEIQHAILHLGFLSGLRKHEQCYDHTDNKLLQILKDRLDFFNKIPSGVLEHHAQLATWHAIQADSSANVFLALMSRQPREYFLDNDVMAVDNRLLLLMWMCLIRRDYCKVLIDENHLKQFLKTGKIARDLSDCIFMNMI